MRNVLVTGSNGQLASCIKDLAKQYEDLDFIYTDYKELDICDLNQVNTFFKSNKKIDGASVRTKQGTKSRLRRRYQIAVGLLRS